MQQVTEAAQRLRVVEQVVAGVYIAGHERIEPGAVAIPIPNNKCGW